MAFLSTLRIILDHPLNRGRKMKALGRYVRWQAGSRLLPGRVLVEWVGGSRLLSGRGESGVVFNIHCGLHDVEDMAFLLHVLRAGDLFVDVGANAGSYTVLAGAVAGARVVAFEPAPETFRRLQDNVSANRMSDRVDCRNMGLGDKDGTLRLSVGEDCMNHVLSAAEADAPGVDVPVRRLDDVLASGSPSLIKIDVEGFEDLVLRGAVRTLASPALSAVILELNGSGRRYGLKDADIHEFMRKNGFSSFRYDPFERTLFPLDGPNAGGGNNTLYVKPAKLEEVWARVKNAPRVRVLETSL
jgi:FkbM family methyltransferase